jgi:hypothetical protein
MTSDKLQQDKGVTPELHPPGYTPTASGSDTPDYRWLWLSLAVVLVLGLLVIFALPSLVNRPPPLATTPVTASTPVANAAANQAMQDWLQLRAKLELENVSRWGEPQWSAAAAAADNGAHLLAQRRFDEAAANYNRALHTLEQLYAGRDSRLATALAAGEQALADNDVESAAAQFETVLAIDSQHIIATRGLARAALRPDVLQAMRAGEQAENAQDFAAAQLAYQQAISLDSEYEPATEALRQVMERQQDTAFRDAMTRTLTALDAGQLNAAGKALAEATQLQPDAAAVADARRRLSQARQQVRLHRLRREAAAQVVAENWQVVADLYTQALSIDSSAGFATEGLARARERLQLHAQFDHYLDKPERLYAQEPLANARQLLAAVSAAPADEPVLAKKITALQALVAEAGEPVAVTLDSDGETEVAIYHVGKLGQFTRHRLELLPGSYTVVGTRRGYRDVRKTLSVSPGSPGVALRITCGEQI